VQNGEKNMSTEKNRRLLARVNALLEREDVDREMLELILRDFCVRFYPADSDDALKARLKDLMVAVVDKSVPRSAVRTAVPSYVAALIGALSRSRSPQDKRSGPRQRSYTVASFLLAVLVAVLGFKE
jgi:hypothetical protein